MAVIFHLFFGLSSVKMQSCALGFIPNNAGFTTKLVLRHMFKAVYDELLVYFLYLFCITKQIISCPTNKSWLL